MSRTMLRKRLATGAICLVLLGTACAQAEPTATPTQPSPTAVLPTATAAASPTVSASCLPIPAPAATATRTAEQATATAAVTTPAPTNTPAAPSKSDGIYTPTTYRLPYQLISTDYQEIATLTNQVNEGKPLPSDEIRTIYEKAKNATANRAMGAFARDQIRTREFPESVASFCSHTFLDDPVIEAIDGNGSAAGYTSAQRRQAIQKGLTRIIYHWSRKYVQDAAVTLNPGLVDEAWAIYVGEEKDGKYPNSIAAIALSRETNFNRPGSLDVPLREALSRAQQAAAAKDVPAYQVAANDVYSRFNAIFYLGATRYMNESLKAAQAANVIGTGVAQVEGLSYYRSIQPVVAKADAAADKTIVAYLTADASGLTVAARDEALAAINRAADALLLKSTDLVTAATFAAS